MDAYFDTAIILKFYVQEAGLVHGEIVTLGLP